MHLLVTTSCSQAIAGGYTCIWPKVLNHLMLNTKGCLKLYTFKLHVIYCLNTRIEKAHGFEHILKHLLLLKVSMWYSVIFTPSLQNSMCIGYHLSRDFINNNNDNKNKLNSLFIPIMILWINIDCPINIHIFELMFFEDSIHLHKQFYYNIL